MPSSDAGEASHGSGMTEGAVKSDEAWLKNNPKKRRGVQRKNKIKRRAREVLTAMADGKTPPKLQKRCKNDWQNCVGVDARRFGEGATARRRGATPSTRVARTLL